MEVNHLKVPLAKAATSRHPVADRTRQHDQVSKVTHERGSINLSVRKFLKHFASPHSARSRRVSMRR